MSEHVENQLEPHEQVNYDRLVTLFREHYNDRTLEERKELAQLLKGLDFVASKLTKDIKEQAVLLRCSASFHLQYIESGKALYHHGDPASQIYILLKGKVRRYTPSAVGEAVSSSRRIPMPPQSNSALPVVVENPSHSSGNSALQHDSMVTTRANRMITKMRSPTIHKDNSRHTTLSSSPRTTLVKTQILDARSSLHSDVNTNSTVLKPQHTPALSKHSIQDVNEVTSDEPGEPAPGLSSSRSVLPLNKQEDKPSMRRSPTKISKQVQIDPQVNLQKDNHQRSSKRFGTANTQTSIVLSECARQITPPESSLRKSSIIEAASAVVPTARRKSKWNLEFNEIETFEGFQQHLHKYFIGGQFRFKHSKSYKPGDTFGELGLTFESSRIATLVAETDCNLLTMDKDTFFQIFSEEINHTKDKVDFLSKAFPEVNKQDLSAFASNFKRKVLYRNRVLYSQNDPVDASYLIREGEVYLEREFQDEKHTAHRHNTVAHPSLRGLAGLAQSGIKVATLGSGQLFGFEDLLKSKKRLFTSKVTSLRVILYRIPRRLLNDMKVLYPTVIAVLRDQCEMMISWRSERLDRIDMVVKDDSNTIVADQQASAVIEEMSLRKPELYSLTARTTYQQPRVSSEKHPIVASKQEEDYYQRLIANKSKLTHNKSKMLARMETDVSPTSKISSPTSLSIWRASLRKEDTVASKLVLHHLYKEGPNPLKKASPTEPLHKKDRLVHLSPLQHRLPSVKKLSEKQHSQPAQTTRDETPLISIAKLLDSTSSSREISLLSPRSNAETSVLASERAHIKNRGPASKKSSVGDISNPFNILNWGLSTPSESKTTLNQLKPITRSTLALRPIKENITITTTLAYDKELEPPSHENGYSPIPSVEHSRLQDESYSALESKSSNHLELGLNSPVFVTSTKQKGKGFIGFSTQKKQTRSNHHLFRPRPENLDMRRTVIKEKYKPEREIY